MVSQNVTIYEVAEAAGVSISTVSNALNRPDRVSDATRNRVLGVAHALGYVPKAETVSFARKAMRRRPPAPRTRSIPRSSRRSALGKQVRGHFNNKRPGAT